ncbi:MAG: penicillin-binding protein, partial [Planctomycetaceae bacterium]|nr:penicillin-binding protein [Planctomycetaceae bacterium]
MFSVPYSVGLLLALATGSPAQEPANSDAPFPASNALAEGVSPDVLVALGDLVQGFVDDKEIVGAELLVIKNGHSILHEAYGWRDREAQVAMETGSVFCVRSMTKPLIGASILMLVDDREIKLDDHVAEYLPSFDVEGSRDITIEHLLTHTSGLPMSLLLGKNLRELDGIQAVAELGAGYELDFEPGSAFSYSDQGTDTLTALIEVVSGMSAAEFVNTRILGPLGMQESACVMAEDLPLRARGCVKYAGSRGEWTRFWGPDEPPLFPFFLGSQGLYSTLEDYG